MTLPQIVTAPIHWTKNFCVFDANTHLKIHVYLSQDKINFADAYWLRVGIFLGILAQG
jgi:hypothetical protein